MNATKITLLLISIFDFIISPLVISNINDIDASGEEIIHSFMESRGIDIRPGTKEYTRYMRGILLGEFPELTGRNSAFVENEEELSTVLEYAGEHSGYKDLYGNYKEQDVQEAAPMQSKLDQQSSITDSSTGLSHSRSMAINYAYNWSISGDTSRNPDFPDFGDDDCTNFISQAVNAGGFREKGSGDGCEYENTSTEWYVESNPSPPIWCIGSTRNWEWSTSWSIPYPFRDYFSIQNVYARVPGWTTSVSTAKYHLSPGDVIQLQAYIDGNWVTYHTMIVTMENDNDLYMTYHSNAGGFDEVDKPLSSIPTDSTHRYLLVVMIYPEVYLPLAINNNSGVDASQESNPYQDPYPAPMPTTDATLLAPYPGPYPSP